MKMWKVYDDNNHKDPNGQQTNIDQKSSVEPSVQVSQKVIVLPDFMSKYQPICLQYFWFLHNTIHYLFANPRDSSL